MQHFDETCCGSESRICERENCFDEEQTWERAGLTGGSRRNGRGFDGLNLTN